RALCAALDVPFDAAMLSWPPGPRGSDGVWARHWYGSVWRSTGFRPYRPPAAPLPAHLGPLLERCLPCYATMRASRLVAERRRGEPSGHAEEEPEGETRAPGLR